MLDGKWRTLSELREIVGGSEGGVSARLRELRRLDAALRLWPRKIEAGYRVDRRRRYRETSGLFEYRVRIPVPGPIQKRLFEADGSPGRMSPTELRRIAVRLRETIRSVENS